MGADTETTAGSLLSGRKLIGRKVVNPQGESLGKVEDLMISAEGGKISYAVVSFGGVLSLGNKLFAFPWSVLHVDQPGKKVILDLDRRTLLKAHGFDKDHWPDSSNWILDPAVPAAIPSVTAAPEGPAVDGSPEYLDAVERQDAPPLSVPVPPEAAASAKNRMEHWGESWQSHGLDRS